MSRHRREPRRKLSSIWAELVALAIVTPLALIAIVWVLAHGDPKSMALPISPPITFNPAPPGLTGDQTHPTIPLQPVVIQPPLTYVVVPGDNLTSISTWFRLPGYQDLYAANVAVIGPNPSLIRPGQVLVIPAS